MNNAGTSRDPLPPLQFGYTKTVRCAGPCKKVRSHTQFSQGSALCLMCDRRKA